MCEILVAHLLFVQAVFVGFGSKNSQWERDHWQVLPCLKLAIVWDASAPCMECMSCSNLHRSTYNKEMWYLVPYPTLSNYPIQLRPATTFFNFTFRLLRSLEHTVDAADQSTAENQYRTSGIPRLIVDLACLLFKALRAPGRNRKLDCKKAFCQLNLSDAPLSLSLPRHGEKMETDLNKSNLVFKSLSHSSFAKLW